jgi:hypothetical protein
MKDKRLEQIFMEIEEAAMKKQDEIFDELITNHERFLKLRSLVALLRGFRAEGKKED